MLGTPPNPDARSYEYQSHVSMDLEQKPLGEYEVSTTSTNDVRGLSRILCHSNTSPKLYTDGAAYDTKWVQEWLQTMVWNPRLSTATVRWPAGGQQAVHRP